VVQRSNAQAEGLFGFTAEPAVKQAPRRIGADATVRHALHGAMVDAGRSGQSRLRAVALAYRDGVVRRGDVYVERLDDVDGQQEPLLLVLVVDESERMAAADALTRSNLALRQHQRENRSLATVARATHSLIVPASGVSGASRSAPSASVHEPTANSACAFCSSDGSAGSASTVATSGRMDRSHSSSLVTRVRPL
jgi:hypothetical protein